jgi:hypothetical protein
VLVLFELLNRFVAVKDMNSRRKPGVNPHRVGIETLPNIPKHFQSSVS